MGGRGFIGTCAATGVMLLGGCASGQDARSTATAVADPSGVSVVATTTMWADIAERVVTCAGGGPVASLTPVGADPHDFSPSSQDVAGLTSADLVVANGLGLEEGLGSSLESARAAGTRVLELAAQLDPLPFAADGQAQPHAEEDAEGGHDGDDPHVWLDAGRAADAAALIGAELAEVTGEAQFESCGQSVQAELDELDEQITATLSAVDPERRILVTDHDALGYFAAAYDFTVAGTVVPGGSTLAEPSSAEMAQLVTVVREAGVPAIFANTANPQALVDALASEAGDIEVVALYIGSLGAPGSGADTYDGFMRTNAQRISDALAG